MSDDRRNRWENEDRNDPDDGPILGKDEAGPAPTDLRDTYGNAGAAIGDATAAPNVDVDMPAGGPYPMPGQSGRPFAAQDPATIRQPTADPSLSRPVDRAAAGLDPDATGYDRTAEGPPPGPLGPDKESQPAEAGSEPAGQWGSSGSRP